MKSIEISGSLRSETGKKIAKQLRKKEQVPAIIYGRDINAMIVVNERDLKPIVYTPTVHIVNIKVDGKVYETIVKDIQFHPVSDKILHIDFLHIFDDKKVTVALPVMLTGQAEGAKQGGKLSLITRKIRACGFPQELPEKLDVDVTNLGVGKTIMVGDLSFENVDLVDLKSTVIASCQLTRVAKGTAAAEGAAAEGGAAAPAADAAPAAEKK
jgi:large subunit ribosomal protein L25